MKSGNVVVGRQPIVTGLHRIFDGGCAGIATGLEHDDPLAVFRQPGRERATTGAGANDDVVAFCALAFLVTHVRIVIPA